MTFLQFERATGSHCGKLSFSQDVNEHDDAPTIKQRQVLADHTKDGKSLTEERRERSRSPRRQEQIVKAAADDNAHLQAAPATVQLAADRPPRPAASFPQSQSSRCLTYTLEAQDGRARAATLLLPHGPVRTPVFMPVGTQGTIKGLLSQEVADLGPQIILGNTYHLANRPTCARLDKCNGLHNFMQWDRNILTDSGGFQMVSLLKLAKITEEGVEFEDPKNPGSMMLLTPEESIRSQNSIGSDIMMQLDDVVSSCEPDKARVEEATHRTTRWLDRCIKAHANPDRQNLFAIVQGGLHADLRKISLADLKARGDSCPGYAIGGLSGGESKHEFWRVVAQCTDEEADGLPRLKPRYCMGVGYMLDIVVSVALGVDMFDCVYPCRTARFGTALTWKGQLRLAKCSDAAKPENNLPIEEDCDCYTCKTYSRSFLASIVAKNEKANPAGATLLTIHNIRFMMRLMTSMREAILESRFKAWVVDFLQNLYPATNKCKKSGGKTIIPPTWVKEALIQGAKITELEKAFDWENGIPSTEDMPKQ
ncbi:unnamed protein product [Amoebophrya sp. A120]|nr:unnamed protein product [Amoebophrya sp. A120]|eukprot:GSA120T00002342001.1